MGFTGVPSEWSWVLALAVSGLSALINAAIAIGIKSWASRIAALETHRDKLSQEFAEYKLNSALHTVTKLDLREAMTPVHLHLASQDKSLLDIQLTLARTETKDCS